MSVLNQTNLLVNNVENVKDKLLPAKQFGASNNGSVIKKKALADVGNTLHQKSVQRNTKTRDEIPKPSMKGKNLFEVTNDKKIKRNVSNILKQEKTQFILNNTIDETTSGEENVEPPCRCCDVNEDDNADILFKNIELSKSLIEDLALNWENPPLYGIEDKRELLHPDTLADSVPNQDFLSFYLESKLTSDIDMDVNIIEVPPVFPDNMIFRDNENDCGIGL